jgi:hypothetical protein
LSAQDIVDFHLLVNGGTDITGSASGGVGTSVTISGNALFATPTGLFFDFEDTTPSFVLFERDSTAFGQGISFFCLNAGGAVCGGAITAQFDIATLTAGRGIVGYSKSDIWNYGGVLSNAGVLQLGTNNLGVPSPTIGARPARSDLRGRGYSYLVAQQAARSSGLKNLAARGVVGHKANRSISVGQP